MEPVIAVFLYDGETAHMHRYESDHKGIGYKLYIHKELWPDPQEALRITIEPAGRDGAPTSDEGPE